MLPFPNDPTQEVRIPYQELVSIVEQILVKKSMFQFDAYVAAQRICDADLYGIPSHGVRCLPDLMDAIDQGDIDPRARILTLDESACYAVLDGSRAVGHIAATKAIEVGTQKAREAGVGLVLLGNSQSLGAAGVYARLAAAENLLAICFSSTGQATVAAPGTSAGAVGNAAIAYAVPVKDGAPMVFDSACGAQSWGKLKLLAQYGIPMPPDLLFDDAQQPTTDLTTAEVQRPAGELGYGMSLLTSVLAGPLCGGKTAIHKRRSNSADDSQHLFLLLDISRFVDEERFQKEIAATIEDIHALPPNDPAAPVRLPGERREQARIAHESQGLPIHRSVAEVIGTLADQFKIAHPF